MANATNQWRIVHRRNITGAARTRLLVKRRDVKEVAEASASGSILIMSNSVALEIDESFDEIYQWLTGSTVDNRKK